MTKSAICYSYVVLTGHDDEEEQVSSWKDLEKIALRDKQKQKEGKVSKATPPPVIETTSPSTGSQSETRDRESQQPRNAVEALRTGLPVGIVDAGNLVLAQLLENNRAAPSSKFGGRTVNLEVMNQMVHMGTSTDEPQSGSLCMYLSNVLFV